MDYNLLQNKGNWKPRSYYVFFIKSSCIQMVMINLFSIDFYEGVVRKMQFNRSRAVGLQTLQDVKITYSKSTVVCD